MKIAIIITASLISIALLVTLKFLYDIWKTGREIEEDNS